MVEYNRNLIVAKIVKYFPDKDQEKIISILDSNERGQQRGQLTVLKLSEGDLEKLHYYLETAARPAAIY